MQSLIDLARPLLSEIALGRADMSAATVASAIRTYLHRRVRPPQLRHRLLCGTRRVPLASFASVFVGEQSSTSLVPVDTWLLTRSSDSINGWLGAFPGVQHRVVPKVALDAVELK